MNNDIFDQKGMKKLSSSPSPSPSPIEEDEDLQPSPLTLPIRDKDWPPIIREIVSNAPANRKLPSFIASLSPLAALATRIRLQYYYDGTRKSQPLLQVIIEAPQSSGKQFAADIERLIMDDTLKARDQEQRRLEQKYREKRRNRKANEKLEDEPKTTIRVIPATISKTVLVKRADFYERNLGDVLTFWMFADELAQVTDAGKQGYSNLRTIMRTAYDFGSRFGMDFASDNSYSAIVDINICSMFCTTPSALDDYMDKKAIEGGNITRTILCQLDDQIGADGALFKPYSEAQMEVINATLQKIMADVYTSEGALQPEMLLDTGWIERDVRRWCTTKGKEALQTGSSAVDVFRKRSSVSAYRAMAICYYLYLLEGEGECERGRNGERILQPSPSTLNRARRLSRKIYLWMADYVLSMLLKRWGKRFEELQAKREDSVMDSGRPKLIDRLSKEFSRDQLRNLIAELKVASPDRVLISQWKANHWIEQIDKFQYRKLI